MHDIVSIWYVAALKFCFVVDSQVKIWSCTLSYQNCHLIFLCLQHHFGTILTIFAKFKYYFDFDILAEMKNYVPFRSSFKSTAYFFGVRNLKAVECIFMFSLPKFDLLLFYPIKYNKRLLLRCIHHFKSGVFFFPFVQVMYYLNTA